MVPENSPRFVCSPQTTFWRSLDERKLNQRYLYAFLRSPDFRQQLTSRAGETDMAPYVSLTAQRTFSVPLPEIYIQREIASCIGAFDDKIELNRQTNETLEVGCSI
jgi:type I restriction enzyme S subunit